ncbi:MULTISPECIES: hypothetical protein [Nostoc]|uniref:Uncharacterized protein n=1 Tax=Nostoc paludosum FACHB-159 TaxID=2692908 RepID=A0ABR8KIT1_9NOSO|nr:MULTISPECIES: hypothetical protein [Nostoc]MBD2683115.1 hypothetical protein [Nostoc sp. FACHB-857]MBD2739476.1 hypothetical protein [Nostoc paludosum FACHB-159]
MAQPVVDIAHCTNFTRFNQTVVSRLGKVAIETPLGLRLFGFEGAIAVSFFIQQTIGNKIETLILYGFILKISTLFTWNVLYL